MTMWPQNQRRPMPAFPGRSPWGSDFNGGQFKGTAQAAPEAPAKPSTAPSQNAQLTSPTPNISAKPAPTMIQYPTMTQPGQDPGIFVNNNPQPQTTTPPPTTTPAPEAPPQQTPPPQVPTQYGDVDFSSEQSFANSLQQWIASGRTVPAAFISMAQRFWPENLSLHVAVARAAAGLGFNWTPTPAAPPPAPVEDAPAPEIPAQSQGLIRRATPSRRVEIRRPSGNGVYT